MPEQILAFLFSIPSLGLQTSVLKAKNAKRKAFSQCGIEFTQLIKEGFRSYLTSGWQVLLFFFLSFGKEAEIVMHLIHVSDVSI